MALYCTQANTDAADAPGLSVYGAYPFTYTAWVYLSNNVQSMGSDAFIGMLGSLTVSPYWSWFVSVVGASPTQNLLQLLAVDNAGSYYWDGYWAGIHFFPIQKWVFVAACIGPTGFLRIYQDLVPGDTTEGSQNQIPNMFYSSTNNYLMMGYNLKDAPTVGLDGILDDVRFYNRRLSVPELETIYYSEGVDNITDGLQTRYLFDEKAEDSRVSGAGSIIDTGPLTNHASPVGTPGPIYRGSVLHFKRKDV